MRASDGEGFARADRWIPDAEATQRANRRRRSCTTRSTQSSPSNSGVTLSEEISLSCSQARGDAFHVVCAAADALRAAHCGDDVSYVVTRNINYTNICYFRCKFCAFSKGKLSESLRGRPYDLSLEEIQRRVVEAWDRGAVEVCLQGGIHPPITARPIFRSAARSKKSVLDAYHAFSPLEIWQGASTLGMPVRAFSRA